MCIHPSEFDVDEKETEMMIESLHKAKQEKALRYNEGKAKWSMVDWKAIEPLVKVLMYGEKKYARDNWKKGLNREEILDSMQRHLVALMGGEFVDPESGEFHIGHIMCNCMFYHHFFLKKEVKSF